MFFRIGELKPSHESYAFGKPNHLLDVLKLGASGILIQLLYLLRDLLPQHAYVAPFLKIIVSSIFDSVDSIIYFCQKDHLTTTIYCFSTLLCKSSLLAKSGCAVIADYDSQCKVDTACL